MRIDPFGLLEITAYQHRNLSGWETRFRFEFNTTFVDPTDLSRWGRWARKAEDLISPDKIGPKRPIIDGQACADLDEKLKESYEVWFKRDAYGRHTRKEAEDWLNEMRKRFSEMNDLYGSNKSMLDQAEVNSKQNWFYKLRGPDPEPRY